jgi:hypothetical protein
MSSYSIAFFNHFNQTSQPDVAIQKLNGGWKIKNEKGI